MEYRAAIPSGSVDGPMLAVGAPIRAICSSLLEDRYGPCSGRDCLAASHVPNNKQAAEMWTYWLRSDWEMRKRRSAERRYLSTEMLALAEAERAELVFDLLDDRPFESDRAELERVWADETARRANQIDSGELVADSWDDVMDKVAESRRVR